MAKLQTGNLPYRDEPGDEDAVSMHTTRDDYEYDDAPELPSYSDSEAAASGSRLADSSSRQEVLNDPYPRIQPLTRALGTSNGKISNLNETTIRMNSLLADPEQLERYVSSYLSIAAPDQRIRMVGSHSEKQYNQQSKKTEQKTVIDFDVSLSLKSHLTRERGLWSAFTADNSSKAYRGSFYKTRAKGHRQDIELAEGENPTLQDWCREYCNNKSTLKAFRVTRSVEGLEMDFLRQSLERVIRATHYHGHVNIAFPIEEKNVDIYNDHWINRWRFGWQRWIFYVTFLWIITWPILFFMTKWWSVYEVRWSWSRCHTDEQQQRAYKVYASMSDKDWVEVNKNLIMSLVLEKFEGDATQFPTDVPEQRVTRGIQTRMGRTGDNNVDAAVSFIQGGMNAWNTLQGRATTDQSGWGADCH